jgi:DNA polymerase-3 subunit epsilon
MAAFIRAASRFQRYSALAGCAQLVAARPGFAGGWELAMMRRGRLAATGTIPAHTHPRPYVDALIATGETVLPSGSVFEASPEEMDCLLRWLESPGTRLVEIEGTWSCPAAGAERLRPWIENAYPEPQRP